MYFGLSFLLYYAFGVYNVILVVYVSQDAHNRPYCLVYQRLLFVHSFVCVCTVMYAVLDLFNDSSCVLGRPM